MSIDGQVQDAVLSKHVTRRGPPGRGLLEPPSLPKDFLDLVTVANGLECHGGAFRVFGLGSAAVTRDALAWNDAPWRRHYPRIENFFFWGENVFGDQFGVDPISGDVIVLACEGGQVTHQVEPNLHQFLLRQVLVANPAMEMALITAAAEHGIRASASEHLSFALPLSIGGRPNIENLEVMDAGAHLDLLGQIASSIQDVPEGTPIRRFLG